MRDGKKEKEMCTFLEKKLNKFREYQSVTEKMKQAVYDDDNNELSVLINKRQRCIKAIERINAATEKIIRNGYVKFTRISKKYKTLMDVYLSDIKDVMVKVDLMDKELVAVVSEKGESIKTELLNMRNMRQAARGYQTKARYPARFLDTRR